MAEEENKKNKKTLRNSEKKILILSSIGVLLTIIVGVSYAWWNYITVQETTNILQTDCFEIKFTDQNPISLEKAYPIIDEEGLELSPYSFTIENVCEGSASYQINLETLSQSGVKVLPDKYVKVNVQEGTNSKITTKLDKEANTNLNTEKTIAEATEAYKLLTGILEAKEKKTFNVRLWIDEDVTIENTDAMNASYKGKISIISSYYKDNRGTLMATTYNNTSAFWGYKENITKIVFEDNLNPHETSEDLIFDVSSEQNGSVMSYLVVNDKANETDTDTYTLYIQGNGGVKANSNSSYLFYKFTKLREIEGLELLNTSKVTAMNSMFQNCSSLAELDLSHFETSNVTDMLAMFSDCSSLIKLDLSNFDTSKVTRMNQMFSDCNSLTSLDLSSFNTSSVTKMGSLGLGEGMFSDCSSLTELDLSHFDTSNVIDMRNMFSGCSSLTNLDVSSFNTSNVTDMSGMFYNCSSLTNLDISSFNTSNVATFGGGNTISSGMFSRCQNLAEIKYGNNFIYKEGATTINMFYSCPANKPTHSSWNNVTW